MQLRDEIELISSGVEHQGFQTEHQGQPVGSQGVAGGQSRTYSGNHRFTGKLDGSRPTQGVNPRQRERLSRQHLRVEKKRADRFQSARCDS